MIRIANKDNRGKYSNAKCGRFFPKNPEKYCGSAVPEYKSSLELLFMRYADSNPLVIKWGYENCTIKYLDRSTNPPKVRRYFIDFVCQIRSGNTVKTVWVEIKDSRETRKPKNNASPKTILTWIKNQSKWAAASALARSKGYEFKVLTENELS